MMTEQKIEMNFDYGVKKEGLRIGFKLSWAGMESIVFFHYHFLYCSHNITNNLHYNWQLNVP
jgi:hypothetical protein